MQELGVRLRKGLREGDETSWLATVKMLDCAAAYYNDHAEKAIGNPMVKDDVCRCWPCQQMREWAEKLRKRPRPPR